MAPITYFDRFFKRNAFYLSRSLTRPLERLRVSAERLAGARQWLLWLADGQPFRLVIASHGYLVAEWNQGIDPAGRIRFHSASKSVYSSLLGNSVAEGKLPLCAEMCSTKALLAGDDGREIAVRKTGRAFFDAHGDFNTPETTLSGMLGGMPVAIAENITTGTPTSLK